MGLDLVSTNRNASSAPSHVTRSQILPCVHMSLVVPGGRILSRQVFGGTDCQDWMAIYAIGRLFFITEGFISVRSLPIGVYNTTNWGEVFPHFG